MTRATPSGACDRDCTSELDHRVMVLVLSTMQARLRALQRAGVVAVVVDLGGNGGGNDLGDWTPRVFSGAPVRSARLGVVRHARSVAYFDEQLAAIRETVQTEKSSKALEALAAAQKEYERLRNLLSGAGACSMAWVWSERRAWAPLSSPESCTNLLFGNTYASGLVPYLPAGALASEKAEQTLYWPSVASPFIGSWTGPVYVIVDGRTASAAEITAAVFQDNHIARLVGVKTAGMGCGFMYASPPYTLPRTRRRYRIPNCVRLRADRSDEVAGIRPDLELPTYEGDSEPARAVRFLEAIGQDM